MLERASGRSGDIATDLVDVAALLRIPSAGGYVVLGVFLATIITLALTAGGESIRHWTGITALLLTVGAAVLAMGSTRYPIRLSRALAIAATVPTSAVLVLPSLNAANSPGYSAWFVLSGILLLIALAVLGRILIAWCSLGILLSALVAWAVLGGRDPWFGLALAQRETTALLAGTLFAIGLRRLVSRLRTLNKAEDTRTALAEAVRVSASERNVQMSRLEVEAVPSLQRIASRVDLTVVDIEGFAALEGGLRDRIRARAFCQEPAWSSVNQARRRGCDILLLDDTGLADVGDGIRDELAAWLAPLVVSLPDEQRLVASIVRQDDGLLAKAVVTAAGTQTHHRLVLDLQATAP